MLRLLAFLLSLAAALPTWLTSPTFTTEETFHMLFHKKEIISQQHTGTVSTEIWSEDDVFSFDGVPVITPKEGKEVRILTLDDIHFSDYGYRVPLMPIHISYIKKLVENVKPDLIILPGDFVCGDSSYYSIGVIKNMLDGFGVPWAPVFGNHDDEANCDLNYLAETMMASPLCLMKKGDPDMGVGNYLVNIADGNGNITETILMMDSHHNQPNERQQRWMKWAADGVSELTGGKAEISAFMHIPIPEYQYAYEEIFGSAIKAPAGAEGAYGEKHERICCELDGDTPVQRGFFEVYKTCPGAKYIFCAHDHRNDFSLEYQGIRLTYLMKLGFSSGVEPGFNGGSVITVGSSGITEIKHLVFNFGLKELENITIK